MHPNHHLHVLEMLIKYNEVLKHYFLLPLIGKFNIMLERSYNQAVQITLFHGYDSYIVYRKDIIYKTVNDVMMQIT